MTDATDAILIEARLDEPPALVWRALTEPELMARWLGESDIEAVVGRRFALRPGGAAVVACEVIEAEPDRLLSYRWRAEGEGQAALDTVVTWILEPTAEGGTRLRLVHDGFPIVVEQGARATAAAHRSPSGAAQFRKRPHLRLRGDGRVKMTSREMIKWAA